MLDLAYAPAGWTSRRSRGASGSGCAISFGARVAPYFLQKADGRFYPDFLCQLPGTGDDPGSILAVKYKGADRWTAAEDDRLIGGLWANLSERRCRFVMVKDKRWDWIEEHLK